MSATDELRRLLDERGVEYCMHQSVTNGSMSYYDRYTVLIDGNPRALIDTGNDEDVVLTLRCTPEQAIAATLGSVPDEIELTQSYDAGFRSGVMAVFQQLEGIESYEELQDLIAEYWGERREQ